MATSGGNASTGGTEVTQSCPEIQSLQPEIEEWTYTEAGHCEGFAEDPSSHRTSAVIAWEGLIGNVAFEQNGRRWPCARVTFISFDGSVKVCAAGELTDNRVQQRPSSDTWEIREMLGTEFDAACFLSCDDSTAP